MNSSHYIHAHPVETRIEFELSPPVTRNDPNEYRLKIADDHIDYHFWMRRAQAEKLVVDMLPHLSGSDWYSRDGSIYCASCKEGAVAEELANLDIDPLDACEGNREEIEATFYHIPQAVADHMGKRLECCFWPHEVKEKREYSPALQAVFDREPIAAEN